MPRVFVCRRLPERALSRLFAALPPGEVAVFEEDRAIDRETLLEAARGVEALLPILTESVDAAVMDAAGPSLRIIANYAVGYNNIDVAAATARGIIVTNTPGVLTETTADLAWLLMMVTARRAGEGERWLRSGQWPGWAPMQLLGCDVYGQTLGIFGMGRIGRAMAKRARGFDMRVIYTDTQRLSPEEETEFGLRYVDKAALLAESDFISIHCPFLPETRHAFGAVEFRAMKRTAILINSARGPIVDEAALADALRAGEIAGAGLDVYEDEPRVHQGLMACENAVLLPHLGSATLETRTRMAEIAVANILAFFAGRTPPNCVNSEVLK